MKKFIAMSFALLFAMNISAAKKSKVTPLQFNPDNGVKASLTMTDGKMVNYNSLHQALFRDQRRGFHLSVYEHLCAGRSHTAVADVPSHLRRRLYGE